LDEEEGRAAEHGRNNGREYEEKRSVVREPSNGCARKGGYGGKDGCDDGWMHVKPPIFCIVIDKIRLELSSGAGKIKNSFQSVKYLLPLAHGRCIENIRWETVPRGRDRYDRHHVDIARRKRKPIPVDESGSP